MKFEPLDRTVHLSPDKTFEQFVERISYLKIENGIIQVYRFNDFKWK